ncbi:MAG: hypothetical protein KDC46_14925 [Thermoleophilia bacterium]|nr:hypothetical protein [Thermoleophilia bacterium]
MNGVTLVELESCESTQDEARERVAERAAGEIVVVRAAAQRAGRGRDGRSWQDPPGAALLLSIARRGPIQARVLEGLPLRVADALLESLELVAPGARGAIAWKAPNDLVARRGGAKVAGILVDARTVGSVVDPIVVGIGVNVSGDAFDTADGRDATSVQQLLGAPVATERLAALVVERVARLLAADG